MNLKPDDYKTLKNILGPIRIKQAEDFLGVKLPAHIKDNYNDTEIWKKLDKQQIMGLIDFTPPFLRIDKIIVFNQNKKTPFQSSSLGIGVVTPRDTAGHYNETIFLAMCGWLMASSASVHLAALFPSDEAPQVVEANGVKPLPSMEGKNLWKPARKGTAFFVETAIIKKKMQLVRMRTMITFGNILFGTIEELKLVLTKKEAIWSAKEFPQA